MENFTTDDVVDWLKSQSLQELTKVFTENMIDGMSLIEVVYDETMLRELVSKIGLRAKVRYLVKKIVESTPSGPSTTPSNLYSATPSQSGPSATPSGTSATPTDPSATPSEPYSLYTPSNLYSATPSGPSATPTDPSATPTDPSATPSDPYSLYTPSNLYSATASGPSATPSDLYSATLIGPSATLSNLCSVTPSGPCSATPSGSSATPSGPSATLSNLCSATPSGSSATLSGPSATPSGPSIMPSTYVHTVQKLIGCAGNLEKMSDRYHILRAKGVKVYEGEFLESQPTLRKEYYIFRNEQGLRLLNEKKPIKLIDGLIQENWKMWGRREALTKINRSEICYDTEINPFEKYYLLCKAKEDEIHEINKVIEEKELEKFERLRKGTIDGRSKQTLNELIKSYKTKREVLLKETDTVAKNWDIAQRKWIKTGPPKKRGRKQKAAVVFKTAKELKKSKLDIADRIDEGVMIIDDETEGSVVEVNVDETEESAVEVMVDETEESAVEVRVDETEESAAEVRLDETEGSAVEVRVDETEGSAVEVRVDETEESVDEVRVDETEESAVEVRVDETEGSAVEVRVDEMEVSAVEVRVNETEESAGDVRVDETEESAVEVRVDEIEGSAVEVRVDETQETTEYPKN